MEKLAEDRYDYAHGILGSLVCMAGDDDCTLFVTELCALISRIWILGRRVHTDAVPREEMLSAGEVARYAAEQRLVRDSAESGSSSSSTPEEVGEGRRWGG